MLLPLPAGVPPQLPAYQRMDALLPRLPPLNRNVTLLPMQTESALDVIPVGAPEVASALYSDEIGFAGRRRNGQTVSSTDNGTAAAAPVPLPTCIASKASATGRKCDTRTCTNRIG